MEKKKKAKDSKSYDIIAGASVSLGLAAATAAIALDASEDTSEMPTAPTQPADDENSDIAELQAAADETAAEQLLDTSVEEQAGQELADEAQDEVQAEATSHRPQAAPHAHETAQEEPAIQPVWSEPAPTSYHGGLVNDVPSTFVAGDAIPLASIAEEVNVPGHITLPDIADVTADLARIPTPAAAVIEDSAADDMMAAETSYDPMFDDNANDMADADDFGGDLIDENDISNFSSSSDWDMATRGMDDTAIYASMAQSNDISQDIHDLQ